MCCSKVVSIKISEDTLCPVSRGWANAGQSGAGRKSGERERSGERTFHKTLERERSVNREAVERERIGERVKSAAQSPLTPNIKDNRP